MDGVEITELLTDAFQASHPPASYPAEIVGREAMAGSWDAAARCV